MYHTALKMSEKCVENCWPGFEVEAVLLYLKNMLRSSSDIISLGSVCEPPQLMHDVTGNPWKLTYEIGEAITLSCPPDKQLEGNSEILCDSSLNWSPQETARCSTCMAQLLCVSPAI